MLDVGILATFSIKRHRQLNLNPVDQQDAPCGKRLAFNLCNSNRPLKVLPVNFKLSLLGALVAFSCGVANAGVIQVGGTTTGAAGAGKISAKTGVCTVTFNGGNAANACGATYAASASNFRTGSVSGQYAAPAGDTTGFFTVGPTDGTPVTVTLLTTANYFGFYAGSLDAYNTVTFFLNGVQVDRFTGTQINAVAFPGDTTDGDQAQAQYIDYFPNSFYNSIIYSSTSNAFETDSHAFGIAAPNVVPEPASTALFGLGALALLARRRRKA